MVNRLTYQENTVPINWPEDSRRTSLANLNILWIDVRSKIGNGTNSRIDKKILSK